MAINHRCPKCGSERVQLSNERSKNGCFWYLIFGWWFILLRLFKCVIGLVILICWDWWMAIIKKLLGKGYFWRCKKWFSGTKKLYYCHDCGHNFRN